ncbi:thiol:disulfide interchange protein DsbA/DsbL [Massilia sp. TSP1-1-2]|uniref:thiol:disulfide interchange protein DsbA/DsbL n=1 Tax=unclassified Massilia TaxID=2609279 RepID=UPI003CEB7DAC
MRSLRLAVAAVAMIATTAMATPADPKNGAEYTTLAAPQPTQAVGKKIEVIEFFAYHCPACNLMEPHVAEWVKKHGSDVTFKRVAFPFQGPADPEAHLWVTLDAMGKSDEYGPKVFRAVHVERQRLMTDAAILDWVAKSGLDKAKFTEYWNSFGVLTKLRRLPQMVSTYKIDGTPTFVVDGKYVTSPGAVGQANPAIPSSGVAGAAGATLDALVAMAMKEKGYSAAAPAAPAPAKKTVSK